MWWFVFERIPWQLSIYKVLCFCHIPYERQILSPRWSEFMCIRFLHFWVYFVGILQKMCLNTKWQFYSSFAWFVTCQILVCADPPVWFLSAFYQLHALHFYIVLHTNESWCALTHFRSVVYALVYATRNTSPCIWPDAMD